MSNLIRLIHEWRHRRQVRDTHIALQHLDSATLRDLGLNRAEISSLAGEIHGDLPATRALTLQSVRRVHA